MVRRLGAGARWHLEHGAEQRAIEQRLARRLHEGRSAIDGVRVLGPGADEVRVPVLAFTHATVDADRIASQLDRSYGIATRAGLHCAPWAHKAAGTLERGAVRISVGFGNTDEHVELALRAVASIAGGGD